MLDRELGAPALSVSAKGFADVARQRPDKSIKEHKKLYKVTIRGGGLARQK